MTPETDSKSEELVKQETSNEGTVRGPKITTLNVFAVVAAIVLVIAAGAIIAQLIQTISDSERAHERYNECASSASQLMIASDYLTTECRMFVVTGDKRFMDGYFEELLTTKRRDEAVVTLGEQVGDERATIELIEALAESNELAMTEMYAMRLVCEATGIQPLPDPLVAVDIKPNDAALSANEKRALAESIVLGDDYRHMKDLISSNVNACATELMHGLEDKVISIDRMTDRLLFELVSIALLLMTLVAVVAVTNYFLVMRPIKIHEENLVKGEPFDIVGSIEIKRVAVEYNKLLAESKERTAYLKHEAETDALTGAYNRGTYDRLLEDMKGDYALILADVDHFKEVNDQYGHEAGDEVLKRVAKAIMDKFRSTDHVCRIGGDEFAVIVTKAGPESRAAIQAKVDSLTRDFANDESEPHVTLSFGIAFSGDGGEDNMYHKADKALYASKRSGRNRSTVAEG